MDSVSESPVWLPAALGAGDRERLHIKCTSLKLKSDEHDADLKELRTYSDILPPPSTWRHSEKTLLGQVSTNTQALVSAHKC